MTIRVNRMRRIAARSMAIPCVQMILEDDDEIFDSSSSRIEEIGVVTAKGETYSGLD